MKPDRRLKIAVAGTGISGLAAAWLLNQGHDITVYERSDRVGGHSNTILASAGGVPVPVDTGFIVFNRPAYPNLAALFSLLGVATRASDMSFAVSLEGGDFEYSGSGVRGLLGQPVNALKPRFWSLLADILRFYRQAPRHRHSIQDEDLSLGEYLAKHCYGRAFREDHLLPMAAAIWSTAPREVMSYPFGAFIRFFANHGLLQLTGRPQWQTVRGGSRTYVARLTAHFADKILLEQGVRHVRRDRNSVVVTDARGKTARYDHIVMAMHADDALAALGDPTSEERTLLGAFRYSRNLAVLHTDEGLMPRRRAIWSSWNYLADRDSAGSVTYWMNRLQALPGPNLFVTLNPARPPRAGTILHSEIYTHPIFDRAAVSAQRRLWSLQGKGSTWYCGAYFGSGFHEDGLQAGLAVAEQLGGLRRPWRVADESGRIGVMPPVSEPRLARAHDA